MEWNFEPPPGFDGEVQKLIKEMWDRLMRDWMYGGRDDLPQKEVYGKPLFESFEQLDKAAETLNRYGNAAAERTAEFRARRIRAAEIDGGE